MKLNRRYIEKPWGRTRLPPMFDAPQDKKIGEVCFTNGADLPLLAKYIFTDERLSIQVHPDDEQASARGLPSGKTECWYILEADPGAMLGLGLKQEIPEDELRAAVLDGSIEDLVDWRPVQGGDFYLVPAGTIHAIGRGLSLLEFQQNSDVTYRLYDYGRRRELHVEDGVAVARRAPFVESLVQHLGSTEERILVDGPIFKLAHSRGDAFADRQRWVMPIEGAVQSGEDNAGPGECLLLEAGASLECEDARLLIGATP